MTDNNPTDDNFDDPDDTADDDPGDPVALPIDGTLDLHTFHPRDVKDLVPDYLAECRARGILEVRIVHGKGQGTLRRMVHAALDRLDCVRSYRLAGHGSGGWGATQVDLLPPEDDPDPS
jgi:dsDNA-specific endonuclease/ATPase MutS2